MSEFIKLYINILWIIQTILVKLVTFERPVRFENAAIIDQFKIK